MWIAERDRCPKSKRVKCCDAFLLKIAKTFGVVSRRTLYRMAALYEQSGIAGLVDGRAIEARRRASAATPGVETIGEPDKSAEPKIAAGGPALAEAAMVMVRIGAMEVFIPPGVNRKDVLTVIQVAIEASKNMA